MERLNQFFIVNSVTEESRKRAILITYLSEETYILVRDICFPDLPEKFSYKELIKIIYEHLSPVKAYFAERIKFYNAKKAHGETVCQWAARVKSLAVNCKFGTELETVIRDVFVIGMNDNTIMDRLFEEDASSTNCTFRKMVKIAQAKESAMHEHNLRESGPSASTSEPVNFNQHRKKRPQQPSASKPPPGKPSRKPGYSAVQSSQKKCGVC